MAYLGFGKGGPWRARGARAYNGSLEAEPPAGSRGRAPGRGVRGQSPPEAETLFASECSMVTANLPIFLKFGNAKDHQTLLNFAILAGKWQKNAPFHIKLPVKNFHGWAKGGASHRGPPPKYAPGAYCNALLLAH